MQFPSELSKKEIFNILDDLMEMGTEFVILTGGEPFCRKDSIEIIKRTSHCGFKTLIATNGSLLTRQKVETISKFDNISIQVSLDGASAVTHDYFRGTSGLFDDALEGISLCREHGIDVSVSFTCTNLNIKEMLDVILLSENLGVSTIKLRRFVAQGRGMDDLSNLDLTAEKVREVVESLTEIRNNFKNKIIVNIDQAPFQILGDKCVLDKYQNIMDKRICGGCTAGIAICVIDPVGSVRPCPSLGIEVGNIRETSFQELWNYSEVFQNLRNRENLKGRCGVCEYKNICGGCRADAHARSGDYLAEDPKCWHIPQCFQSSHNRMSTHIHDTTSATSHKRVPSFTERSPLENISLGDILIKK
jgi:radical SAM protein with 4Fe4S-binding SPASM domain